MTDEELVHLFKTGANSNYAFNLIVEKHQEKLYWMINRIIQNHDDTDDVLQNVFIKAWKALPKFREDASLYTWLYRIAANESFTFVKKNRKHIYTSIDDSTVCSKSHFDEPNEIEIIKKLNTAIATLPEKQRLVFHLKYFEEKKYEQISQILGTSVGGLKASYHHAVKKIESFLSTD